jgi:heterodisulfide reductase subunit B
MASLPYYPGCTLNTVAKAFDQSARRSFRILGIELAELAQWNCCGASFPLTPNNVIGLTGPTNVLIQSQKAGGTVSTLCSFCYNTLKRTNLAMKEEQERRAAVNDFLGTAYDGEVRVLHLLEVLRDRLGYAELKKRTTRDLRKLKVAAYYGCTLLRPKAVAIDDTEAPRIFEDFLRAIGCEAVEFPNKGECCGAHLAMSNEDIVVRLSGAVLASAQVFGAELVTTTCPLCFYNLERSQKAQGSDTLLATRSEAVSDPFQNGVRSHAMREERDQTPRPSGATLPLLYFTQLLGLALGVAEDELGLDGNLIDPRTVLRAKGIIGQGVRSRLPERPEGCCAQTTPDPFTPVR